MEVVIYIALAQSIIALSLIIINHSKNLADRLLSYFFVFAVFHLILKVIIMEYLNDTFLFYNFITPPNIAYTPILFLFLEGVIGKKLKKSEVLLHFIPLFLASLAYLILGIRYLNDLNQAAISTYCLIMRVACTLSFLLYPVFSFIKIKKNKYLLKSKKAYKTFLVSNGLFVAFTLLGFVSETMEHSGLFVMVYLCYVLIFVLLVNLKFNIITTRTLKLETEEKVNKKKYNSSNLSSSDVEQIKEALLNLNTHKSEYLNPDFNLESLSKLIDTPKHHISQVLNEDLDVNFQQFINSYRIDHFCELVESDQLKNKSIIDLAFECGFNSKSSFNANFKKIKGITPTTYINSVKNEITYA